MKAILTGALLGLTVSTAVAAVPDAYSASYMLPYCKDYLSASNTLDVGFCAGVVEGIGYMAAILEMASSPGAGPPLCVPKRSPAAKQSKSLSATSRRGRKEWTSHFSN
jgi:hypothetical protein